VKKLELESVDFGCNKSRIFGNEKYFVWMENHAKKFDGRNVIRIYIKRKDNQPISPDWSEKQQIKNELVGPEYEAVELNPAESRLHNQTNIYDLFVIDDELYRFSFGLNGRSVFDHEMKGEIEK
jgi:hypothetical protein